MSNPEDWLAAIGGADRARPMNNFFSYDWKFIASPETTHLQILSLIFTPQAIIDDPGKLA
jgi:hypothetical protein